LVFALPGAASAQAPQAQTCPFTFDVLHDDHVGRLALPAGSYSISVFGNLSCDAATDLFRQFLEDYDGRLARPWVVNVSSSSFTRGRDGTTGFSVKRGGKPGGGGHHHPAYGTSCPGFFRILHNDRIGRLRLPAGRYRITLLSVGRISCARASRTFARFLQDYDGLLPPPWFLDVETASFMRGSRNVGFRVKEADGPPINPNDGISPADGTLCPGTFRVLHNDRIGPLRFPAGPYRLIRLRGSGLTCARVTNLFSAFLDRPDADLPRPWVLSARSATFRRGRGSRIGFRVDPTRPVR